LPVWGNELHFLVLAQLFPELPELLFQLADERAVLLSELMGIHASQLAQPQLFIFYFLL